MQWQLIVKKFGNVSDWLFYAGEGPKEVADWPGLTVFGVNKLFCNGPVILPYILNVSAADLYCFDQLSNGTGRGICAPLGTCFSLMIFSRVRGENI